MGNHTPDLYEPGLAQLRLGLCQVHTEAWDVVGNLSRTREAIAQAAREGAELAVTPECVLTGYPSQATAADRDRLREAAEPLDGAALCAVRAQAQAAGVAVLLGFAERAEGGVVHNSAVLIGADGEIRLHYRKVHCRPFESIEGQGVFTPGERFDVTDLVCGGATCRVGVLICFDREIPESVRCLRALGAQLVLCPLATDTWSLTTWYDYSENEAITRCRAAENEVFIAVVNHAGRFNGGSFMVGPGGEVLAQLGCEAEVRVVAVPVGVVGARFHDRPLGWMGWGHRRPAVYARYLGGHAGRIKGSSCDHGCHG